MQDPFVTNHVISINPLVAENSVLVEILHGLKRKQKTLPPKLFYDERGSRIFERICELEEYYPTRTETAIMQQNIQEMVDLVGSSSVLIEYGSGSSEKTRILLDHLPELAAYVPVDISRDHLYKTADSLRARYPHLAIEPVWADYTSPFEIPPMGKREIHPLAYFPGSTIGNFFPDQVIRFLGQVADLVGLGGGFLIGVDLKKDPGVLHRAYNDSKGVTADFNLNMLRHINHVFNANFNLDQFEHEAVFNQAEGRIEMYLISKIDQVVFVENRGINFTKGERILTEVSYKYSLLDFEAIAARAGFSVEAIWTDPQDYFSVQYLKARTIFDQPGI